MSLATAIAAEARVSPSGARCSVATLLEQIPDADRKVLVGALAGTMAGTAIARALRSEYPDIFIPSGGTLLRHRKRECCCP